MYIQIILILLIHILLIHFYLLRKEQTPLISNTSLYIFLKIYNLEKYYSWTKTIVVVAVGRAIVIAVRRWIVRAIIVVIATPISTRIVGIRAFSICPCLYFLFIKRFF